MLVGEREGGKPGKGDDVTELIGRPESAIFFLFEKVKTNFAFSTFRHDSKHFIYPVTLSNQTSNPKFGNIGCAMRIYFLIFKLVSSFARLNQNTWWQRG